MRIERPLLKPWHIAAIVLAGTVIRFIYGYYSKAWMGAPDQLAWGLSIDEMLNSKTWSYAQLIHAPHEGGSFFIGLLSMIFRPFQSILPPLSLAALAVDIAARFIEIKIAQKLFGRETALWFGAWTILSVPLMIPWATVNFGLHPLFSFIPFVFLYFVTKHQKSKYLPVLCGIISGIAVSLIYDSVVLAIASIFFLLFTVKGLKNKVLDLAMFFTAFLIAIVPHLITRIYLETGYPLVADPSLSIRGVPLGGLFTAAHFINLSKVWVTSLPGSFLLSSVHFIPPLLLCMIVGLFLFFGIIFYLLRREIKTPVKLSPVGIIFLFIAMYAFSPFYGKEYQNESYVYYRHLCFIIPFLVLIVMNGFVHSDKLKLYLLAAWIVLCGIASVEYMASTKRIDQPAYRAAGWILAKKYGGKTSKLFDIRAVAEPASQDELLIGFGWGISATIFQNTSDQAAVERLCSIIRQCPEKYQPKMIEGVYYSFNKGITPILDARLPAMLHARLGEQK